MSVDDPEEAPREDRTRIERYSTDSDSWFLVYCDCEVCKCQTKHSKVRERHPSGKVIYWCTYCFTNHRETTA